MDSNKAASNLAERKGFPGAVQDDRLSQAERSRNKEVTQGKNQIGYYKILLVGW